MLSAPEMGGQKGLGTLLRPDLQHFPASAFLRSSVAKGAVHILDADMIGFCQTTPDARLAVLLHVLTLFEDAGLKKQLVRSLHSIASVQFCVRTLLKAPSASGVQVLVAGGRRPPFKRDRGPSARDGSIATSWHALYACLTALEEADFLVRMRAAVRFA